MIISINSFVRAAAKLAAPGFPPATLAACIGIALTIAAVGAVSDDERLHKRAGLDRQANSHAKALQHEIEVYLEALHSIFRLFAASDEVDRQAFETYVGSVLRRRPGTPGDA